jgi:sarcosine oxidase subunit beta
MERTADIVIIGGGVTGTSIAMHLARRGAGKILLLERESIAHGGTGRSSAIIRTHYANPHTTRMAVLALEVFRHFGEAVGGEAGFRAAGYMMVASPADALTLRRNVEMHQAQGADTGIITHAEALELDSRLFLDDVGAICYEPHSGYADPAMTAGAFATAARDAGALIQQSRAVTAIHTAGGRVTGVTVQGERVAAPVVINAAGYHARAVGAMAGAVIPVEAERHYVALFQRPAAQLRDHPIVSDRILNAYFRPEGHGLTLVGSSDPQDAVPDADPDRDRPLDMDRALRFGQNFIHRFPALSESGMRRGYTGIYDTSPDHQPLLGSVPGIEGFYCAAGLSGHGFKLSPIIGQAMAELVLNGEAKVVNLHPFRLTRFVENDPIRALHPYGGAFLS